MYFKHVFKVTVAGCSDFKTPTESPESVRKHEVVHDLLEVWASNTEGCP